MTQLSLLAVDWQPNGLYHGVHGEYEELRGQLRIEFSWLLNLHCRFHIDGTSSRDSLRTTNDQNLRASRRNSVAAQKDV